MSKVISVLEKMSSDAAMNSESAIADLVAASNISDGQQQAIITKDIQLLKERTKKLHKIRYFIPVVPAEDDEPADDEQEDNTKGDVGLKTVAIA